MTSFIVLCLCHLHRRSFLGLDSEFYYYYYYYYYYSSAGISLSPYTAERIRNVIYRVRTVRLDYIIIVLTFNFCQLVLRLGP
jgi:hypothetical protein